MAHAIDIFIIQRIPYMLCNRSSVKSLGVEGEVQGAGAREFAQKQQHASGGDGLEEERLREEAPEDGRWRKRMAKQGV